MDFRVSRESFLRVLTHVSSIVDSRSTIPILSNIYIKCENNQLEIRSTDMDISIREFVSTDSSKNGEATVNSRILTDIIRKTKKNSIVKCKLEGNRLIINSDNSVFELNALTADEFPKFVQLDPTNSFELSISEIKRLFNKTMIRTIFFDILRHHQTITFNLTLITLWINKIQMPLLWVPPLRVPIQKNPRHIL